MLGLGSPRTRSQIKMEPVYPIEVAMELGKWGMVKILLDAGANPPSSPSSPSTSIGSIFKWALAHLKPDKISAPGPLRSCLRTGLPCKSGGSGIVSVEL